MPYHALTQVIHSALVATRIFAKSDALVRIPSPAALAMAQSNTSSKIFACQSASVARVTISSCFAARSEA